MLQTEFSQLCRNIWPRLSTEDNLQRPLAGIFAYFLAQTEALRRRHADITVSDVTAIIGHLTSQQDAMPSRKEYLEIVRSYLPSSASEAAVHSTGDRTLRMLLTLDVRVGSRSTEPISPVQTAVIDWVGDDSLSEAIANHFMSNSSNPSDMVTGRIDPSLSLPYLCSYRGFRIFWTSNLSEHLSINWKSKIVTVYEHKAFLWYHLRNSGNPIIPRPILEEAIDTLNLLFPLCDDLTRKFLAQNGKEFQDVGYCSRPRDMCLDLGKFHVWRDRVAELAGIMNEDPKGLKQLLLEKDGRNLLPFVTFWVAIAVAFLSLVNIPFTVVSMLYTVKQYQLALAQACADPSMQDVLPQYCSPG
ncbi:hypothetical protein F5Y16DRAFT_376189 [Xylariaceae sp. FL0255]|nr:hypothetical protein F5Y16DRAFT_376189 [Xylariaceae sp. FL0255]